MAQGALKKSSKPAAPKQAHSKRQASKVGKSNKKKSNTTKASVDKMQRKFTAGLTARTEALLGERAGHLELIGKGKKADKKTGTKGGTKKFG